MVSRKIFRGKVRPPGEVLCYNASSTFPSNADRLNKSRKDPEIHKIRKRGRSAREPTISRLSTNCRVSAAHARSCSFSQNAAGCSLSQIHSVKGSSFSLKRPRTSWGKPHARFVKLIDVLANASSSTTEAFPGTPDRELIEFVPSSWSGDHYDWFIPSDSSSSSSKPPSEQLPYRGILSDATINVCSLPFCAQQDFSIDDVMSFVVTEDYCDVGSVLDYLPFSREQDTISIMGEISNTCISSVTGTDITPNHKRETTTTQLCTEIRNDEPSEEDYSIDLSEFKPDIDIYSEPDCTSNQKCMQGLRLTLDYQDVLNAWADGGCLWADGKRPQNVHVEW